MASQEDVLAMYAGLGTLACLFGLIQKFGAMASVGIEGFAGTDVLVPISLVQGYEFFVPGEGCGDGVQHGEEASTSPKVLGDEFRYEVGDPRI